MLPFEKLITNKSVILLFIFLTSTSFGFLENFNRDEISRRSVRKNRASMDRGYVEELPFRRDISRHANEKDRVYENLYDRRSFRTGTGRHIRVQDRERFSNFRVSDLEERFTRLSRDNRFREPNYGAPESTDRSRYLVQNDRRIRDNKIMGAIRQHRERSEQNQDRVPEERIIRENPSRENRERILKNSESESRLQREPSMESLNRRIQYSRDNREHSFENRDRFSRDSRVREVRQQRERTLDNRDGRLDHENNRIREGNPSRQFREIRYQREQNLENRERNLNLPEDRSRTFRNVETGEQSLDRKLISRHNEQRLERSLDNRERVLKDWSFRQLQDKRMADIRHSSRSRENRYRDLEERTPSERSSQGFRTVHQQVERHLGARATRYDLSRRYRNLEEQSERNVATPERNLRQRELQEKRTVVSRDTRELREHSQRNMENRNRRVETSNRSSRFFEDKISRQQRERSLENRGLQRTDRSSRRLLDNNMNEIRQQHRVRSLDNRDRFSDVGMSGTTSFRLSREAQIKDRRERNLSRERLSTTTRNNIRKLSYNREVLSNRFSEDRSTRIGRDNSRFRNVDDTVALRTLERRYRRNENQQRNLSRDRNSLDRYRQDAFRNDASRAGLSRSDSTRQTVEARINSRQSRDTERQFSASRQDTSTCQTNQRHTERKLPAYRNVRSSVAQIREVSGQRRDTPTALRSTNSPNSIERRMVPVAEYVPNSGRSFDRITDIHQNNSLVRNFKFDALANVIQVVLGVYLIGQIFTHSSKKRSFGFQSILPSLNSIKEKLE